MSASQQEESWASAVDFLTNDERRLLLEVEDFFDDNYDLLKNFPSAAPKIDQSTSFYPPSPSSPLSPPESKPSPAELAHDLLQQLDTQCKQENTFSNWLEEKVDLPSIFENISEIPERVDPQPPAAILASASFNNTQPTEELLREFETVYGAVELTHLTPPQSPPGPATQLLLSYAQQAQCVPLQPPQTHPAPPAPFAPPHEPWQLSVPAEQPLLNYEYSLEAVEELVRHRASQLASPQHSSSSADASPRSSPRSSPPSSPRSSSADEDWAAPSRLKTRGVDDRRSRKKEQNKNAATRYRQKKKAEVEVLLKEEQSLRQRHTELGEKCSDLQREIRYIKALMRDLFKAKGLIK